MMIEELDYQRTPLGELILRRRRSPRMGDALVYEVKLDNEMLMSSSVNESERALARLAMESRTKEPCDVLVGGLGLGYTAAAVLDYAQVRSLDVVELLAPVIQWHRARLVPAAERLIGDPRCSLIEGDFFKHVGPPASAAPKRYHVILADIDHSPESWLHPHHQKFYSPAGLDALAEHLWEDGMFGLWSAEVPSADFVALLRNVFPSVHVHAVTFFNPHIAEEDTNWVVLAGRRST